MIVDQHIKESIKSGDKTMSGAFRSVKSKILLVKTSKDFREQSDEALFLKAVQREIKELKESNSFIKDPESPEKAKNDEVIEKLSSLLPKTLSAEEQLDALKKAVESSGAKSAKDMGKVMQALAPMKDRLDMKFVSGKVRELLAADGE